MLSKKTKEKDLIGVFDSGLGGLTILKYFLAELPNYNYLYLADNARLPYGSKTPEIIYQYTKEGVDFLFQQGCKLVILACNTASAYALDRLREEYLPKHFPDRRIFGVIRPLAEAVSSSSASRVGILATQATVDSEVYLQKIKKLNPQIKVWQSSAPLLVPLIEEGWLKRPETNMIIKKYLRPLKVKQIDTLLLACTHYPILYQEIKRIGGRRLKVLHPGEIIANSLKEYLTKHPDFIKPSRRPSETYYVTNKAARFKRSAEKFLEHKIKTVKEIDITL
ncbi:MAG: glutamate racemase [Patescibacteria group bacterium]|jgi:glutamate racemase